LNTDVQPALVTACYVMYLYVNIFWSSCNNLFVVPFTQTKGALWVSAQLCGTLLSGMWLSNSPPAFKHWLKMTSYLCF